MRLNVVSGEEGRITWILFSLFVSVFCKSQLSTSMITNKSLFFKRFQDFFYFSVVLSASLMGLTFSAL